MSLRVVVGFTLVFAGLACMASSSFGTMATRDVIVSAIVGLVLLLLGFLIVDTNRPGAA